MIIEKIMKTVLRALFIVPVVQAQVAGPVGNAVAGKQAWDARRCQNCHGEHGEGGFGPDLAGRQLTFAQFKHAVRTPWGVMPSFSEEQASDPILADMRAWLLSLPTVAEPGKWEVPLKADAPHGQKLLISVGCAQCHHAELRNPRYSLGGVAKVANFEYFAKMVYDHNTIWRGGTMGNFSRDRVPESVLQEIFRYATQDLGLLPTVVAAFVPEPMADGANSTYKLIVKNRGLKNMGLTAEDVTITIPLVPGTAVVGATGAGYQGVQNDPQGKSAAVWKVPSVTAGDLQTYTLTIAGKGGKADQLFKGTTVGWARPQMRPGISSLSGFIIDPILGPGRTSSIRAYLDREISADNDWVGGPTPPGVCSAANARREMAGCEVSAETPTGGRFSREGGALPGSSGPAAVR